MKARISKLRKTKHFLLRQWERCIDEQIISYVKPFIQRQKSQNKMELIITPSFLRRIGYKGTYCLVLIVRGKTCITCYWKEFSECLFGNAKFTNPQIL